GLNPSDIGNVEDEDGLQVYFRPPNNVGYLGLTVTREPFGKKKVRKAINYAIDKQSIVDTFYADKAKVASAVLPDTIEGHNEDLDPYEYDPEKAKELLDEAGFSDGFDMELWA